MPARLQRGNNRGRRANRRPRGSSGRGRMANGTPPDHRLVTAFQDDENQKVCALTKLLNDMKTEIIQRNNEQMQQLNQQINQQMQQNHRQLQQLMQQHTDQILQSIQREVRNQMQHNIKDAVHAEVIAVKRQIGSSLMQ